MKKIRIEDIRKRAETRADGYLEECLASGAVDGKFLLIDESKYDDLRRKYSGLGDAVAAVAKPIAAVIDGWLGTKLTNCKGCAERQKWLNSLTSQA